MSWLRHPARLRALNSLTKYPSIPTYHPMGDRGRLQEQPIYTSFEELQVTEKLDGANARILTVGDDWFLGSREEFLYARGDLFGDPAQGIVEALRSVAEQLVGQPDTLQVVYGEVYGGRIGKAGKQYGVRTGFRVFDRWTMSLEEAERYLTTYPLEDFSGWRDRGGQPFDSVDRLARWCAGQQLEVVPSLTATPPPMELAETYAWLQEVLRAGSQARLDPEAPGQPEGVVIRTPHRSKIAKLRLEDYQRTLRAA
jgi:hypothetical protein